MNFHRLSVVLLTVVVLCGICELGQSRVGGGDNFLKMKLGGVHNCKGLQNSAEIESLAQFAVQEHNKKQNSVLEFRKVLKVKEQVVAGKIYYLTLEAIEAGKMKIYEAKVWVKPWMNFKELQEFKHATSFVPSYLPVSRGN